MRLLFAASLCLTAHLIGQEIQLTQVTAGPDSLVTDIENAGDGSGRLFIVQQVGVVRVFRNGALAATPFLDIRSKTAAGGERGLLGLAFPPGYAQKGRFYVDYTDLNGDTVIAQYRLSANPDVADASTEIVLLHITQPFANHNGGEVRFGPDGYLYIGMGDGGSGGDPMGNGQNLGVLLGKLLRIDVEGQPGQIRIPPDNPFVNTPGARPEIWAYGLRNPWRFSFDPANNALYIADVGQDLYEEIDYQPPASHGGQNYGWNIIEATHCYGQATCNTQGLTLPVAEYTHAVGCSIVGGFVYRGSVSPGLRGVYLYGDYCSGTIWGLQRQGGAWTTRTLLASGLSITTAGEDEAGEIYFAEAAQNRVYRVVGSQAPRIEDAGAVNIVSLAAGVVPGSAATVFVEGVLDSAGVVAATQVPLTTSLGGVSVKVNGIDAPLFAVMNYAGQEQVNFQVPFGIAGQANASLVVSRGGTAGAAVSVPVLELQPAAFTLDGTQGVVVHNADYTLATAARPLQRGEYAFVYAVGLGRVSNTPPDGAGGPYPALAVAQSAVGISLGGVPCEVPFAGLPPGLVGVYQVNFKVPAGSPSGLVDLILTANGVAGPAVKAAVQ